MPLDLNNFDVLERKEDGYDICFVVRAKTAPGTCQRCRELFSKIYSHGSRWQFFHDLPVHGKRVALKVDRRRFKCTTCGATFEEHLPDIHPRHNMTNRLVQYICETAFRDTFTRMAEMTGVTDKTIRNVFHEYSEEKLKTYRCGHPRVLGIDEIYLPTPKVVFVNIEENSIVNMLDVKSRVNVENFLRTFPKDWVKFVTMDMCNIYRTATHNAMPNAKIIVDKFHVMRMGINVMEAVRKEVRKSLTDKQRRQMKNERHILLTRNYNLLDDEMDTLVRWGKLFPYLTETYDYKERFMDIWDTKDVIEAMAKYNRWKESLTGIHAVNFKDITTAYGNWWDEIWNIWRYPYTNAGTESMNARIRDLYDKGKGYTFDVIRAKILFQESFHKRSAMPKFDKLKFRHVDFMKYGSLDLGSDISKILAAIDDGTF